MQIQFIYYLTILAAAAGVNTALGSLLRKYMGLRQHLRLQVASHSVILELIFKPTKLFKQLFIRHRLWTRKKFVIRAARVTTLYRLYLIQTREITLDIGSMRQDGYGLLSIDKNSDRKNFGTFCYWIKWLVIIFRTGRPLDFVDDILAYTEVQTHFLNAKHLLLAHSTNKIHIDFCRLLLKTYCRQLLPGNCHRQNDRLLPTTPTPESSNAVGKEQTPWYKIIPTDIHIILKNACLEDLLPFLIKNYANIRLADFDSKVVNECCHSGVMSCDVRLFKPIEYRKAFSMARKMVPGPLLPVVLVLFRNTLTVHGHPFWNAFCYSSTTHVVKRRKSSVYSRFGLYNGGPFKLGLALSMSKSEPAFSVFKLPAHDKTGVWDELGLPAASVRATCPLSRPS
ncbi:hypothetical protein BDR07DRAFT_1460237 [Suillus spraguei]|nr:hypothetical protein BDR07DRAFT_1460237 [Suillus spraguei]